MNFYTHIYPDSVYTYIEFQGHPSKVKVTWAFWCFSVCVILRLPADSTSPWVRLDDLVIFGAACLAESVYNRNFQVVNAKTTECV